MASFFIKGDKRRFIDMFSQFTALFYLLAGLVVCVLLVAGVGISRCSKKRQDAAITKHYNEKQAKSLAEKREILGKKAQKERERLDTPAGYRLESQKIIKKDCKEGCEGGPKPPSKEDIKKKTEQDLQDLLLHGGFL